MDSASALQALQSFAPVNSADALSQAESKYGVSDLKKRVGDLTALSGNLTSAISAVDPSVTARTAGSLTTEGQRSALVSRERAPIVGQLGSANDALKTAGSDYNDAEGRASSEANATVADNQRKYQQLKDSYEVANAREEAAKQAAAEEAQRQESIRQFNVQQATTRGSSSYGGGGSGSSTAATPASSQRSDGGFNFQNAGGTAISARLYAQLTGTSFNTILKKMAASGDKGAADVLKNGSSSKYYKSLTWD